MRPGNLRNKKEFIQPSPTMYMRYYLSSHHPSFPSFPSLLVILNIVKVDETAFYAIRFKLDSLLDLKSLAYLASTSTAMFKAYSPLISFFSFIYNFIVI